MKQIKNPFANSIVFTAIFFIIAMILADVLRNVFGMIGVGDDGLVFTALGIVLFLIYLLVYRKKFNKLLTLDNFKQGLILGLPIIILIFGPYVIDMPTDLSYFDLSLYGIVYALVCALGLSLFEETIYRGAFINSFMEKIQNEKSIPIMLLLGAVLFALSHAANLFVGADVNQTIVQVIYTFGLGAILIAIVLRTGNILVAIFWHWFLDFIPYLSINVAQSSAVLNYSVSLLDPTMIFNMVYGIVLLVIAFYYIRPKKYSEIMDVWNLKKI